MQAALTNRPRPVTATVTKPRWMQIPNPDVVRKTRRKSLESNCSTVSLTSLLDHDSYRYSASDVEGDETDKVLDVTYTYSEDDSKVEHQDSEITGTSDRSLRGRRERSNNSLSPWEMWVIEKAKSDRQRKQKERLKKKKELADKEKQEQEKRNRIKKAESTRSQWLQMKDEEMHIKKKIEKLRLEEERREKEELDAGKKKAAEKLEKWQKLKKEEEKERMKKRKEEEQTKKQLEMQRKLIAEEKFQEWLKVAQHRPRTSPNSFGYLSGKMTGYHDRSAYPEPSFYNPIPWQPPVVPSSHSAMKKENKNKIKTYKWNPDKYL